MERKVGAPLERLFDEFSPEPFATASLSQVHRAVTPDGSVFAVKVRRPRIGGQTTGDLTLLGLLACRLERRRPDALAFRPTEAVSEFAGHTRRELDFPRGCADSSPPDSSVVVPG